MINPAQLSRLLYSSEDRLSTLEQLRVLGRLALLVNEQHIWEHNARTRYALATELGIAEITLKITLRELLKKKHLIRVQRGIYKMDPRLIPNNSMIMLDVGLIPAKAIQMFTSVGSKSTGTSLTYSS